MLLLVLDLCRVDGSGELLSSFHVMVKSSSRQKDSESDWVTDGGVQRNLKQQLLSACGLIGFFCGAGWP